MGQAASVLMNSLRYGGCQAQIFSALSDTLVGRSYGVRNRGQTWVEYAEKVKPDIVIVTTGAHIATENNTVFLDLVDEVLDEMHSMKNKRPHMKFGWKTQTPGGCTSKILSPENVNVAAKKLNFTEMEYNGKRTYNWAQFHERDLILISRLAEIEMPYLDMRMMYSRSDSHIDSQKDVRKDCLHICVPGPLDVIGRLFYKFLLELE